MKIAQFLRESVAVRLFSTASRLESRMNKVLADYGLSVLQSLILVSIFFEEKSEVRPKELHVTFRTSKGNISHCLSRLEELKLLKRVNEVSDRRGCYVRLTKKGEDLSKKLIGYFHELENQLEAALLPVNGRGEIAESWGFEGRSIAT